MTRPEYRRIADEPWHFMRECKRWPQGTGMQIRRKKPEGEICKACLRIEKQK